MNLLQLLGGAAAQTLVSVLLGAYVRRQLRLNREQLEPMLLGIDVRLQRKGARVNLRRYRKAIAAGAGFLLTGLLTWASTDGVLEQLLQPVVPEPLRPLVGVLAGGIATTVAVIKSTNDPLPAPSEDAPTIDEPAPPVVPAREQGGGSEPAGTAPTAAADATPPVDETTAAAAVPVSAPAPFWLGVAPGASTSPTAIVRLPDIPTSSPL
jgi:hypothetical protein